MLGLRGARTGKDGARWSAGAFNFFLLSVSCAHIGDLRLITLNSMKASEEITDEQSRQVSPVMTLSMYTHFMLTFIAHV